MAELQELHTALSCATATFYCITPDGSAVVALPADLEPFTAHHDPPTEPMVRFDPRSFGSVISTFLAAVTDGYGTTTAMMVDGSNQKVEIFNLFEEADCAVACITETEQIAELDTTSQLVLPARRITSQMSASGKTLTVNDGVTRLLGWSTDEYISMSSLEKIHPDDRERAIRAFAELVSRPNGQSRNRQRMRHSNGSWLWLEITHTNMLHTAEPHIFVESLDISDEMRATLELQERETLLRLLTETLPVGVLQLRPNGESDASNSSWSHLTDTGPSTGVEEFLGRLTEGLEVRQLLDVAREDGILNDISVTFADGDAVCRNADLAIRPVPAAEAPFSVLLTLTDTTQSVATQSALHRQSRHDHLTSALNRRGLEERVTEVLKGHRSQRVSVLYCDLNDFKEINDSHGHDAGDAVLEAVASEIAGELREDDLVGRWGGDEFLVVFIDLDPEVVTVVIDRIKRRLRARTDLLASGEGLSMAIGRADAEPGDDFDALIRRADAAMYAAKAQQAQRESDEAARTVA